MRSNSSRRPAPISMPLDLMTAQEIAEYMRISERQARRLMGKMPCYALGPRTLRVSRADLIEFIDQSRREPSGVPPMNALAMTSRRRNVRPAITSATPKKIGNIVLAGINGDRERAGLRPLTLDEAQAREDAGRSQYLA